jgi:preprotein translocase subunit SecY
MDDKVGLIIGIGIALFITAIIMPMGLNALANSSTAMPTVNSSVKTMLIVLCPVIAVVSIVLLFLRHSSVGG